MSADHYALFTVRNTSTIPMQITVHDAAGTVQIVATLAPGAETTQVSPVEATWSVKFAALGVPTSMPAAPETAAVVGNEGHRRGSHSSDRLTRVIKRCRN